MLRPRLHPQLGWNKVSNCTIANLRLRNRSCRGVARAMTKPKMTSKRCRPETQLRRSKKRRILTETSYSSSHLPQEILRLIASFSTNHDTTLPITEQALPNLFGTPVLHVNRSGQLLSTRSRRALYGSRCGYEIRGPCTS